MNQPLRVLVLAQRVPWPLQHGGALRLHHFLRELAARCRVTLAVVEQPADTPHDAWETVWAGAPATGAASPSITKWVSRRVRQHFGFDPRVATWLAHRADPNRYDVLLLAGSNIGVYAGVSALPTVWELCDEPVLATMRRLPMTRARRWRAVGKNLIAAAFLEREAVQHCTAVVCASPADAAACRRVTGHRTVVSVSNGVETYAPSSAEAEPGTVAFVGTLDFPPNVDAVTWFARRVWPRLTATGVGRQLSIIGRNPVPAVEALTRDPTIALHANVPSIAPWLARAEAVVVPIRRGTGVKNKLLEACAAQRATVASPQAVAGLTIQPGEDVLLARGPAEWTVQLTRVLTDPALRVSLAANGCAWVRREHSWAAIGSALYDTLRAAATTAVGRVNTFAEPEPASANSTALDAPGNSAREEPLACR